jgi:hypothetical protein
MLSQENIDKLRTILTQAIDQHLANGGTLVSGKFYDDENDNAYCPVSCLIGTTFIIDRSHAMADVLEAPFSVSDLWNLIDGFDQYHLQSGDENSDLYKLGQELRAKYLPKVNP